MVKKKKLAPSVLEVQNAAKTLFANIRFMSPDSPVRTITITSSIPNEGKTFLSIELARAIAMSGKTVLLVEADMRKRTLANRLNIRASAGMYSVLTGSCPLEQAVVATTTPNMFFLDVEPNIPNPADVISSKRYRNLVASLKSTYDYVIYDTPPVGAFIDAAILSTLVDGVVMVIRPSFTKRTELLRAFEQLKKADANVLGICATFCAETGSEYYYAYYTREGERTKRSRDGAVLRQKGSNSPARMPKDTSRNRVDSHNKEAAARANNRPRYASSAPSEKGRRS